MTKNKKKRQFSTISLFLGDALEKKKIVNLTEARFEMEEILN